MSQKILRFLKRKEKDMRDSEKKGMIALIIPTIVWGSVGINVRLLNQQGLEPFTINFINMLIGTLFIFFFAKYKGHTIRLKNGKRETGHLLLQGFFFGCTVIFLFYSFIYIPIANATFLQGTMPLWVMVLSLFLLREKITRRKCIALLLSFAGIVLLLQVSFNETSMIGSCLALLSAMTYSGMVLNGRNLKNISEYTTTFFQLSVAGILMMPFMLINLNKNNTGNIWMIVFLFLFLGIVNTGITQRLFLYGLRFVEASKASILTFIEPVSATLLAFLFFSEKLTALSLAGVSLILLSVALIITSARSNDSDTKTGLPDKRGPSSQCAPVE